MEPAAAPNGGGGGGDVSTLPSSEELLDYYRSRVAGFEKEREGWLAQVASLEVSHEEQHKAEWEARQRREEIRELQGALSGAHAYLFEERQRFLDLQAENDELKLQELDDRRRIAHLLALTQPEEQEITYLRDRKPDAMVYYPRAAGAAGAATAAGGGAVVVGGRASGPTPRTGGPAIAVPIPVPMGTTDAPPVPAAPPPPPSRGRVMRTVYMPTANTDALLLKVESLSAQLDDTRTFAAERVAALLEDKRVREMEADAAAAAANAAAEAAAARLARAEKALMDTTKALVLTKRAASDADSRNLERLAAAESALVASNAARAADASAAAEAAESARVAREAEKDAYVAEFRCQLKTREEELSNMEAIHAAVRRQWEQRIAELEAALASLRARHRALEYRRALDLEGYTADVGLLRQKVAAVDRRVTRARLVDRLDAGDRLDAFLARLPDAPTTPVVTPPARPKTAGGGRAAKHTTTKRAPAPPAWDPHAELSALRQELEGTDHRLMAAQDARQQEQAAAGAGR